MAKNPDAKTGYKRPPADHEILLTMAIVDPGYMVNMPQGATGASGCDMHDICGYINLPHGVQ